MSRRPAAVTQSDVARVVRAAKQSGAGAVQIQPDGTITILLAPPPAADAFEQWERGYEQAKAARRS
jgi:hypothetical protein